MITTANNSLRSEAVQLPSRDDLARLAQFRNRNSQALSLFFGQQPCSDLSHRRERLTVENLIRERWMHATGSDDITAILKAVEGIEYNPASWRACYISPSDRFEKQFLMPAPLSSAEVQVDAFFFLAPLVRAVQSCMGYDVLLVERGHVRLFAVSGTEVTEEPLVEDVTFRRRSEDNRVGWSNHIEHNLEHAAEAWFASLSSHLEQRYSSDSSRRLVIACRADVRAELQPVLAALGNRVIGWTALPGLEISPAEVVQLAKPIFEEYQLSRCEQVLKVAEASTHPPVTGVSHVLGALESGRVRTLLIGSVAGEYVFECTACGAIQATSRSTCDACGSAEFLKFPADEACIRSALCHDAEILVYPQSETNHFDGIAASLRY